MITMGCDIGSLFAKIVIVDDEEILASRIVRSSGTIGAEIDALSSDVRVRAGIDSPRVEYLVGTGKGAHLVRQAAFVEDEVNCVAAAASYCLPEVDMAIDIGGQSITSILFNEEGEVESFMRNDKCASGSGRFLEVMAVKLGIDVGEIDESVARSGEPVLITSQCGVFAESEVISRLNDGIGACDIVAGLCSSVANIVVAQGRRFGTVHHYTLTGGVARLQSVVEAVRENMSGTYHRFPHDPMLGAAIGAALLIEENEGEQDGIVR